MPGSKVALSIQVFVTGWFFAFPAAAPADTGKPAAGEPSERLGKLEEKLDGLSARLKELEKQLAETSKQITAMEKSIEALLQAQKNAVEIEQLRTELSRLRETHREEADKLRKEIARLEELARRDRDTTAFYSGPPAATDGRVLLVNDWIMPVSVIVDNRDSYQLLPGQSQVINRPAGTFTYEVLGIQPAVTRVLPAGRTLTIRIHPR
jgi:predicted RNase H-like nuclease (RuvC/YqgF family)